MRIKISNNGLVHKWLIKNNKSHVSLSSLVCIIAIMAWYIPAIFLNHFLIHVEMWLVLLYPFMVMLMFGLMRDIVKNNPYMKKPYIYCIENPMIFTLAFFPIIVLYPLIGLYYREFKYKKIDSKFNELTKTRIYFSYKSKTAKEVLEQLIKE